MQEVQFNFPLNDVQQKQRKALIDELKKNKIVQDFLRDHKLDESILDQKAQMISDYVSVKVKCENCKGLSACKQENTGYVLGIQTEPLFSREYQACTYQRDLQNKRAHQKQFSLLEVDEHFLEARMDHLFDEKSDIAYKTSIKTVIDWFNQSFEKGFYFYGAPGCGKTHLAMAICNYFALKGQKVSVVHVPSLASKFPNSYYEGSEKEAYLQTLKKAHCVLIDDIGAETYTSYFRDEVLFPILNERMEKSALTLFTSNHSLIALENHYRFNQKADDEAIKAMRLLERIKSLANELHLQGSNRRG